MTNDSSKINNADCFFSRNFFAINQVEKWSANYDANKSVSRFELPRFIAFQLLIRGSETDDDDEAEKRNLLGQRARMGRNAWNRITSFSSSSIFHRIKRGKREFMGRRTSARGRFWVGGTDRLDDAW